MARAPGGTVTVLFTDLVGSTELMERLGDEAAERFRRTHFRLLRNAVATRGGQEVKTLGDGLMVVFASTVDALACAVAMQQAVHAHNQRQQDPGQQLEVRVGLDVGEPIRHESDYFGMPVVVAKRLCDSAQGGQIIVSELVRGLVASHRGHVFRDLGARSLKGIGEAVAVHELVWGPADAAGAEALLDEAAQPSAMLALLVGEARTPLVGRAPELETMRRCWTRALAGSRQFVALAGEPGIGKTRLAVEFALEAQAAGAEVLFGRADEGSPGPYQPFVDALQQYAAARLPGDLPTRLGAAGAQRARLVSELAEQTADAGDDEERQARLFQALASFLGGSSPAPMLLVLDDLQWAGATTLQLLKHVMRRPERSRLLVIGTYRDTDVTRTHPLAETLADLRRARLVERIELTGLGERAVGSLVATWAGQDAPAALSQFIYSRTEGNPLFTEEMLRHLAETGAIYDADGRLRPEVALAGVPEGVNELIGRRLARLSDECNSVLTIASVIGREFGLDALERASDLSDEQLVDALEEAVRGFIVRETPHTVGRYSFTHALIHEALYAELTTTRRVRLHGQTLQYADSDGVKLAYEVLGAAGPFVVAVGLSNCPAVRTRNVATARRWERLTRSCRLLLYDRRGVGFSAAPERGYSLLASVADLRAVLDAAGAERAILWGAVDGGPLAIAFAAQHPERVAGLLLLGTTPKYVSSEDFPWGVRPAVVESFLRTDAVDRGRAVTQLSRTRAVASDVEAIAEVMRRVPRRAWTKIVASIGVADARDLLPHIRVPTLIVNDPHNTYIPVEASRYLHEHIAGSKLVISEEYGMPLLGEALYRTIESFIDEAARCSPP